MRRHRSHRGSAIAETGPALFMFLIIIFFPMLDVMGMAAQYACGWYHNHLMLQELPVRLKNGPEGNNEGAGQKNSGGGPVHKEIYGKFTSTGIARFAGVETVIDDVSYVAESNGLPAMVRCTTTIQGRPFISLPFLGFTKTEFRCSGEATREVLERNLSMANTNAM